jgi:hypothetical protein
VLERSLEANCSPNRSTCPNRTPCWPSDSIYSRICGIYSVFPVIRRPGIPLEATARLPGQFHAHDPFHNVLRTLNSPGQRSGKWSYGKPSNLVLASRGDRYDPYPLLGARSPPG